MCFVKNCALNHMHVYKSGAFPTTRALTQEIVKFLQFLQENRKRNDFHLKQVEEGFKHKKKKFKQVEDFKK